MGLFLRVQARLCVVTREKNRLCCRRCQPLVLSTVTVTALVLR